MVLGLGSFTDAADAAAPPPGRDLKSAWASVWERVWVRRSAIAVAIVAVLYAALALILPLIDFAPQAGPLEASLSRALGRNVIVGGGARVHVWPRPAVKLDGLFVANAEGAPSKQFLLADHLKANVGIDLATGSLLVTDIFIDGANIAIERSSGGEASWNLPALDKPLDAGMPAAVIVRPRRIVGTNLRLRFDGDDARSLAGRGTIAFARSGSDTLQFVAGDAGASWTLDARIAGLKALLAGLPVQMTAELKGPGTLVTLKGGREAKNAKLVLEGAGRSSDFAALERLIGLPGGQPGIEAEWKHSFVSQAQSGAVKLAFTKLGAGDLSFEGAFKSNPAFELVGNFSAEHLDLRAFAPGIDLKKGQRLILPAPVTMPWWQAGRVKLELAAVRASLGEADFGPAQALFYTQDGILILGPVRMAGPGGSFEGDATINVRGEPELSLTFKSSVPDIAPLIAAIGGPAVSGRLDAAFELSGKGQTLSEIAANGAGQTNLLFGEGRLAPELAAALPREILFGGVEPFVRVADAEDPVGQTAAVSQDLRVGCLVSRFDISGGVAESRSLLLETANAVTTGEGRVDLADEALDLHLSPRPRNPMLIGTARDMHVTGTITSPEWKPEPGDARRGLARSPGRVAIAGDFAGFMPLLVAEAGQTNPCVKALMGDHAFGTREARATVTR